MYNWGRRAWAAKIPTQNELVEIRIAYILLSSCQWGCGFLYPIEPFLWECRVHSPIDIFSVGF